MDYQLTPLYQLIIDTRCQSPLPDIDSFLKQLSEIQQRIIHSFETLDSVRIVPMPQFNDFIRDHFLSLMSYEDKLFKIPDTYAFFIRECIKDLKEYLLLNYSYILDAPKTILPEKRIEKISTPIGFVFICRLFSGIWKR